MSGRRRDGSGRGRRVATARGTATVLSVGICLFAAPAAHADLEDLLDAVIGAASAGADPVDVADLAGSPVDLDASGVLQDPLAQLDQLFHDTAGQSAPAAEGAPADTANPGDTTPASPGQDTTHDGAEHAGNNSDNSSNPGGFPKLGMPGGGNGGSGGGPGGSGSPAANAAKTRANSGAAKPVDGLPKADAG